MAKVLTLLLGPVPPHPDWLAGPGQWPCEVYTRIDREGMGDARCGLRAGHPGQWHYTPPEAGSGDEMWWRRTT